MNRRRFLTAKSSGYDAGRASGAPPASGTAASSFSPFATGCASANCWICTITIWIYRKAGQCAAVERFQLFTRCALMNVRPLSAGVGPRRLEKAAKPTRFISRRGTPLSRQQAYRIIRSAGEKAGTMTQTHPHMLRHACGYELAERGTDTRLIQDYLGHRNIRHTVRYTASNAARFAGIWEKEIILLEKALQNRELIQLIEFN